MRHDYDTAAHGRVHTGRAPRLFSDVPRVSVLRARAAQLPPLPVTADNAAKLPAFVGMMGNDRYGDCTCAGMAHLIQIWSQDAGGAMLTEPDAAVLRAYHEITGFDPATGQPDLGAAEQDVMRWWQQTGFPLSDGRRLRVGAVYEANPRNLLGLCEVIVEFGAAYVGFEVPGGFMEELPPIWWDNPAYSAIESGHCVLLHSFDRSNPDPRQWLFGVTSWGTNRQYRMRGDFLTRYVDEAYGVVCSLWFGASGRTPYNLDPAELEAVGGQVGRTLPVAAPVARADHGALEAARHGVSRSPHWPTVEREVRAASPHCLACADDATASSIQVHHVNPFHYVVALGRPDLELTPGNLVNLCETEHGRPGPNHHLRIGHLGNFREGNRSVREDATGRYHGMTEAAIEADPDWLSEERTGRLRALDLMSRDEKIAYRRELDAAFPIDGPECRAVVARFPGTGPVPFDEWVAGLPAG